MLNIPEVRKRCANSIRNTPTGKYLDEALDELKSLRERDATLEAGRAVSSNLPEIAAEQRDPAKWAAMMILKELSWQLTRDEAAYLIEGTLRHALALMLVSAQQGTDTHG